MPGRDPLAIFTDMARTYGDVAFFKLGGERVYFINHPQHIRDVLVTNQKNFTKSRVLERAKKFLGEGLLTNEGPAHLRQRRLAQPAFHRERIAGYATVMVHHAARMRERWQEGTPFDVSKEMMRVTLSIVGKTLFDADMESKADEVSVAVTDAIETFFLALLPFSELIEALPIPIVRRGRKARDRLDALIYRMIADRRLTGRDHGDLLSMLLAAQDDEISPADPVAPDFSSATSATAPRGMSDKQVRDEAMTILLAGHETTANALTWTWYLLSQNPGVEAKLHEEIDRALEGRLPAMTDLSRLPYVERVVTEALRLYPPAWMVGRRAIADFTIGEYVVPARSMILMSQWVIQRDARFYAEPERFNPDRWTPEFKAALPKFAYFPFGGGARQCIGEQFAWMELVLVVATIAQQWQLRLVPAHPVVPQPLITLRARHGMMMTAARRADMS
jgi:cytochrome P450